MIQQDLLQGVLYPLLILILIILLIVVIAETKKSIEEKRMRAIELERQRIFKEKIEYLKKKREEEELQRALEERALAERVRKEKEALALEMEKERKEWELSGIYTELLSTAYSELAYILPKESLEKTTKSVITNSRLPLTLSETNFRAESFISENSIYNFVLAFLKEYTNTFGSPIAVLALASIKKELAARKLTEFSEGLKTLSLLELELKSTSYLIEEEEPVTSYQLFSKLLEQCEGLCITRQPIDKIAEKYGSKFELYWLTKLKAPKVLDPVDLEKLMALLENFLEQGRKVIMLDGIEYLIVQNNYKTILKFVQSLNSVVALKSSVLIIPINPTALEPRELALLEREMKVIK
ncbi:MAG: DUF835 domain-containing protein [Candidatus Thermoplasmatota archaeon]|nr:DUF835 domain-containing protein [Candidatus Thermoplasmatota archaeon]